MAFKQIPAPKTGNWKKAYGSWEGFVKAVHRSIGRNLGGGIMRFVDFPKKNLNDAP